MSQIRTELRTQKERIEAMHARASEMKLEAMLRRSRIAAISVSFAAIAVILDLAFMMPAIMESFTSPGGIEEMKGSILSGSPVLGYVVIGVLAFLLGTAVTMMCYKTITVRKSLERERKKQI